ncbi:MAG: hypothetical protein ABW277_18775 [Longimicrobiaceae bacterium]
MFRIWPRIAAAAAVLPALAGGLAAQAGGEDTARKPFEAIPLGNDVVLRPKRVALTNRRGVQCEITHPLVTGGSTPELRDALQETLSLESVLDIPLGEARKEILTDDYLCYDIGYSVRFRRGYLLDVGYSLTVHSGGRFRYGYRNRVVDLRTGERLLARQVFDPAALPALAKQLDRRLQADITKQIARDQHDGDWGYLDDTGAPKRFREEDLGNFSVDEQGITFYFEFAFPDMAPFQPAHYFLSWSELRPYVRPDGALAPLLR